MTFICYVRYINIYAFFELKFYLDEYAKGDIICPRSLLSYDSVPNRSKLVEIPNYSSIFYNTVKEWRQFADIIVLECRAKIVESP